MNRIISAIFLITLFLVSFLVSSSLKGTLAQDEPGIIRNSLNSYQSIRSIFNTAAFSSQPPLSYLIRTYTHSYWGNKLSLNESYPELFHRSLSIFWWLIPIGYFIRFFHHYSSKTVFLILLSLGLISTSHFMQFYLSEARHYSAIAAVFSTMILIYLGDQTTLNRLKYHFFFISLLLPFLHLISFSYYFVFVLFFLANLRKEKNTKNFSFITHTSLYVLALILIILMYIAISRISIYWQSPSIQNIPHSIDYANIYFQRTLDWIFAGTFLYPFYQLVPDIITSRWLSVFILLSPLSTILFTRHFLHQQKNRSSILSLLFFTTTVVWPVTFFSVIYRSNYFVGERYSIIILISLFFAISQILTNILWSTIRLKKHRFILGLLILSFIFYQNINQAVAYLPLNFTSPENQFVNDNKEVIRNPEATIILDNGTYDGSIVTLAKIKKLGLNANIITCRSHYFLQPGNELNTWIKKNSQREIYIFGLYHPSMNYSDPVWRYQNYALYRISSPIPQENICQNNTNPAKDGSCYLHCLVSIDSQISPDGRSVKYTAPHIDIPSQPKK